MEIDPGRAKLFRCKCCSEKFYKRGPLCPFCGDKESDEVATISLFSNDYLKGVYFFIRKDSDDVNLQLV